jgi:signal transduction histidine kinase
MIMSAEACLRWLARNPSEPDEARKSATRVIEQGRRANDVIAGLRSLVRDAPCDFAEVDIHKAIEEVLQLARRQFERANVTLRTNFDRSLPKVEADRVQLQQVVLNLVRNAVEAMAFVDGRSRILTVSSMPSDDGVSIMVADTGIGINPVDRERLFDAFFTTKGDGLGLGLGLSICRKIVTVHGGRLWVEENITHGTTFIFVLPLRRSILQSGSS